MSETQKHLARVKHLRKNGHSELADNVELIAKEKGYENDYHAVQLRPEGEGHNSSLMTASQMLRVYWELDAEQVIQYLETLYLRSSSDVERAVSKVFDEGATKSKKKHEKRLEVEIIPELVEAITPTKALISPDQVDMKPREILTLLFSEEAFLNMGAVRMSNGNTMRLNMWTDKNIEQQQFIVPNPMIRPEGKTQDGKDSPKCNSNIKERKYLVVESDVVKDKDHQLGIILFLAQFAPLVLIMDSGSKSLHAWFDCGNSEGQRQCSAFFYIATLFGADTAMWTVSQYCRLPNGLRENGNKQQVIYFATDIIDHNDWNVDGLLLATSKLLREWK